MCLRCQSITGYTPYELLGKSMYMFVHVDDLPDVRTAHENGKSSNIMVK